MNAGAIGGPIGGATPGGRSTPVGRPVVRRRTLPGSRALVGGFLIAASGVGVFAAYSAANAAPATSYVVVGRDVSPGERLASGDLDLVPIDLPVEQRTSAFTDRELLVGAVTVGALSAGQLVHPSDVADPAGAPAAAQISVPVRPASAMNGDTRYLRGGELVDVIVTTTVGGAPLTSTVSRSAEVVEVLDGGGRPGAAGTVTVVLAVPPTELEAVAQGASIGDITLARTTGLERARATGPGAS